MTFPGRLDLGVYMDLRESEDCIYLGPTTSTYAMDTSYGQWTNANVWTVEFMFRIAKGDTGTLFHLIRNSDDADQFKIEILSYGDPAFTIGAYSFQWVSAYDYHLELNDGAVHHLATTWDCNNEEAVFYIDGTYIGSFLPQNPSPTGTGTLTLGVAQGTAGGSFSDPIECWLSDVRIWIGEYRTAKEIFDNYQFRLLGTETNLESYWKCDEGTGSTLDDETSSNENLTLYGSGYWDNNEFPFLTDVTSYIDPANKSFRWSSVLGEKLDTTGFSLEAWSGTKPEEWDEVVIYDGTTRIFGGFANQVITSMGGDAVADYYVGASSYESYLDHVMIKEEYEGYEDGTGIGDGTMIMLLLNEFVKWIYCRTGIITDGLEQIHDLLDMTPTIALIMRRYQRIRFNRMTLRQVINQLAKNANANWYISPNRVFYFFPTYTADAPYDLSESPNMSTTYPFHGMAIQEGGAKLVNRIEVVGGNYLSIDDTVYLQGTAEEERIIMPFRMHKATDQDELQVWRNDATPSIKNYTDDPQLGNGDLTQWTTGGTGTITRDSTYAYEGTYAIKNVGPASGVSYFYDTTNWRYDSSPPAAYLGNTMTFSAYVYMPTGVDDNEEVQLVYYYDIGEGWESAQTADMPEVYDEWYRLVLRAEVPADAIKVWFLIHNNNNQAVWFDAMQLEVGTLTAYIDGTIDDCSWDGTAHQSTSTRSSSPEPVWTELDVLAGHVDELVGVDDVLHYFEEKVLRTMYPWPELPNAAKLWGRYEVPLRTRYTDDESYAFYGKHFDELIADESIIDKVTAKLRARAILDERAFGSTTITCHVREPGLFAGQQINVNSTKLGINDDFLIRRVDASVDTYGFVKYALSLGVWNEDLYDTLVRLNEMSKPTAPWREDEVLDDLVSQRETLEVTETAGAPSADTGPYQWNVDDWDFATYS